MCRPDGLLSANALMQLAMMGVRVIGPAAAGVLVAAFGATICYSLDVVSFLGSAALIGSVAIIRPPMPPRTVSANSRVHAVFHDMSEGIRFIFHHAALFFVVMAMAAGLFTIGCFGPLIAVYVREWLHGSSGVFGIVSAMVGVGMMAGTPAVRRFAIRASNSTLVLSGLAGIGVGALLLGAMPWVPSALAGTFTLGFAFAAIIVPAQTLMQRETPHAHAGPHLEHGDVGCLLRAAARPRPVGRARAAVRRARRVLPVRRAGVGAHSVGLDAPESRRLRPTLR